MNHSILSVVFISLCLAAGHLGYQYFFTDIPSLVRAVELAWFQFNALILYWVFTK